jgi:hypothetical protein
MLTRRKILLIIWAIAILATGFLITRASGSSDYGIAASLSLLAISLGVPLMRAMTEFSK